MRQLSLNLWGMAERFHDERLHKEHVHTRKRWLLDLYSYIDKRLHNAHVRARAHWRRERWQRFNGFHNEHVVAWRRWQWSRLDPGKRYAIRVTGQLIRRLRGRGA